MNDSEGIVSQVLLVGEQVPQTLLRTLGEEHPHPQLLPMGLQGAEVAASPPCSDCRSWS